MMFWELLSIAYYGFLFPNTAYAKLNTGIEGFELAEQGLYYLWNSLTMDLITLPTIAVGISLSLANRSWKHISITAGCLLYLAYIVTIGGDFMSGRFLTVPLFCCATLIARSAFSEQRIWILSASTALLVGLLSPHTPLLSGSDYGTESANRHIIG